MKTNDQPILATIILLVLCFGLSVSNAVMPYIPPAYSQEQGSLFQSEVKALDDMPSRKVKVVVLINGVQPY